MSTNTKLSKTEKTLLVPFKMTESMKKTIDEKGKTFPGGKSEYLRTLIDEDTGKNKKMFI